MRINTGIASVILSMIIGICTLSGAHAEEGEKTVDIIIQTSKGDIELRLYPGRAPLTVENFLENMKAGLYKNAQFYRASRLDNNPGAKRKILTLIQGGMDDGVAEKTSPRPAIAHETTKQTGISHLDGVISMARNAPGTATTEFFICIGDNRGLDYGTERYDEGQRQGYATFGRVIKGMDVVIAIQQSATGAKVKDEADWFGRQLINDLVIIDDIILKD